MTLSSLKQAIITLVVVVFILFKCVQTHPIGWGESGQILVFFAFGRKRHALEASWDSPEIFKKTKRFFIDKYMLRTLKPPCKQAFSVALLVSLEILFFFVLLYGILIRYHLNNSLGSHKILHNLIIKMNTNKCNIKNITV